jgi:hypothetical protein
LIDAFAGRLLNCTLDIQKNPTNDYLMGGLKTLIGILILSMVSGLGHAQTSALADPLRTFAACAGRLSAQMEFEWMFDGPASEATKARREVVLEILDAMMPPDAGRTVLNWRIESKMAHASLLTRSKFDHNPRFALRAERLAARNLANCDALLLG